MLASRSLLASLLLAVAASGCKDKAKAAPVPPAVPAPLTVASAPAPSTPSSARPASAFHCTRDPAFPTHIELPEASSSTEVELMPGKRELLVVADGKGRAFAWTLPSGPGRNFNLPLEGDGSTDLEGMAWHDGKLWTLTSSGAVRVFVPDGAGGVRQEGEQYRIGAAPKLSCDRLKDKQCGMNYEGLCLRAGPVAMGGCAGWAVSKARGHLLCVRFVDGKIAVDDKKVVAMGMHKHALSDCAFGTAGGPGEQSLVVTTNFKGGSTSYRVNESTAGLEKIEVPGTESNEAIAIDHDGALYVFADAHQKKSEGLRFTCEGWSSPISAQ